MDYLLLGWQTSTYKLKGSDKKWFMKPYIEIAEDTGIPLSTLQTYLREFCSQGFIEKRQALYNRKNEKGEYEAKKGAYIHITETFLELIKPSGTLSKPIQPNPNENIHNDTPPSPHKHPDESEVNPSECSNFEKNERTDPLILRGLYIRDLYTSFNNTIKLKQLTHSVDKPTLNRLLNQYETIQQFIRTEIKEEIPDEIKKLLLGTFFNLTFEHKKQFSIPKQIVAEYLFSLINTEFCLPKVHDFKHRNDILSKIMRENNWRTPKGFYNYFYLGQNFKDKKQLQEQQWQETKELEMNPLSDCNYVPRDNELLQIEAQIFKKATLIEELTKSLYQQTSEELIVSIREKIQTLKAELNALWHDQWIIEREIEQEDIGIKLCA
ncbi:hypothetical protein [Legionella sp.]|uniref:hypothetical protein n=1 Tax=Legionella sp. TaxID=459 RepID=UPI003CB9CCAB